MRERKEKEKQTEQDREISTTQWCVEAMKAEIEVKEEVFQRVSSAWLYCNFPAQAWTGGLPPNCVLGTLLHQLATRTVLACSPWSGRAVRNEVLWNRRLPQNMVGNPSWLRETTRSQNMKNLKASHHHWYLYQLWSGFLCWSSFTCGYSSWLKLRENWKQTKDSIPHRQYPPSKQLAYQERGSLWSHNHLLFSFCHIILSGVCVKEKSQLSKTGTSWAEAWTSLIKPLMTYSHILRICSLFKRGYAVFSEFLVLRW